MLGRRNGNGHNGGDLEKLIDLYLLRCDVEGKSPFTVVAYGETLRLFQRITAEEGIPAHAPAITPAHIYAYLGRVAETGVSLETRHRRHREVRSFFSWLERMGYIEESPFARIKNVRLPQKIVQPYTPEEVGRIPSVCDERSELGARDRAMVRRYSATYNAEKAARAHARWSPGDMLDGRLVADPTSP